MSAILLEVVLALTWWAYAEMARSLRESAHTRLDNVSAMLAQNLQSGIARSRRAVQERADSPAVRAFLQNPTRENRDLAREAITFRGSRPENNAAIEILGARGERVLVTGKDSARVAGVVPRLVRRDGTPETNAIGGFHAISDDLVVVPAIAMVREGGRRLGYVVEWHIIQQTEGEREVFSRLLGSGARFMVGSNPGIWTDQVRVRPPPPPELPLNGEVTEYDRDGRRLIGKLSSVPGSPWQMLIEFPEEQVLAPALHLRTRLLGAAAVLIVISFILTWLLSRRVTKPLKELTVVSEAIAEGDYTRRAKVQGLDEFVRLERAFNLMSQRVERAHADLEQKVEELRTAREQFVRAQRMEAVGQLAGGVAHDFNNLLTVILAESDMALQETDDAARVSSLGEIKRAGERAAALTRQLLAFSRHQLFAPVVFNLPELVRDLERMMTRLLDDNIRLNVIDLTTAPNVHADKAQIEQVLVNLVVNARDAMPDGGTITVEARNVTLDEEYVRTREDLQPGDYVVVSVSDTGTGIPPEVMPRIFEPFFTTKEQGRGTGLGLATSYGIVKQSGGYIGAYSEPGIGTTMRVFLPVVYGEPQVAPRTAPTRRRGDETVLLVEDDAAVRQVALRILEREGYHVLEAASGEEGVELMSTHPGAIDLILTDVVLPGIGGRIVAERAAELRPQAKVLFTSGYTDDVILQHNLIVHDATLIGKPFTVEGLTRGVREALDN